MAFTPDIDVQSYKNSIPSSLKPQGTEQLGTLVYNQGKVIQQLLTPIALRLLSSTLTDISGVPVVNGKIDLSPFVDPGFGPIILNLQDVVNKTIPEEIKLLFSGDIPFKTTKFLLSNPVFIKLISRIISESTNLVINNGVISTPFRNETINISLIDIVDNNLSQVPPEIQNTVVSQVKGILTETLQQNICKPSIQAIIVQRNALVNQLNSIGRNLDITAKSIARVNDYFSLALTLLQILSITKTSLSISTKAVPTVPGAVTSILSDLEDAKNKITFDVKGVSKLEKIQKAIASAGISISLVNSYILVIVELLNVLDFFLKQACPDSVSNFESISEGIKNTASTQIQAENTQNQTTYEGFVIEIEEVPYAPNVTRRRAIGKNTQGIVLIQTELSFTTNNQTLINELKLIIDRDNLKGY